MKKSQMEVDFDKWLSSYTGTCSDNHALYQAFCAGHEAADQLRAGDGGYCVCLEGWSVDVRGDCSNCGLPRRP